ncbi:MAG: M36 family metallopeptidase, partial [Bacteroidota bacterium]
MKKIFTLFALLLMAGSATMFAQDAQMAIDFLQEKHADLGLTQEDVQDLRVTDDYTSGGIRHVYVAQQYRGIPIFNAQAALHYRGTRLLHRTTKRLEANLAANNLSTAPALSAQNAVRAAVGNVSATFGTPVEVGTEQGTLLFSLIDVSPEPIRARLVYFRTEAEGLRLAWDVTIDQYGTHSDYWSIMIDAQNGDLLDQFNQVLKCTFSSRPHKHDYASACAHVKPVEAVAKTMVSGVADGSSYNVFPFGTESPLHGERMIVEEPADDIASPFGWHDTDGEDGPEFTITRGNNVYAYPDRNDDNSPDAAPADGGADLDFDFFYGDRQSLDTLLPAAVTQLFYTTNVFHDWLHFAGFDEASGNFQEENYSGEGRDRDAVRAEAQDGADLNDGAHRNNANFFTPPDGQSPRMQMYKWVAGVEASLAATFPASLAGDFTIGVGNFGVDEGANVAIEGHVVLADPELACAALTNDLTGKVALIRRGTCEFGFKVLQAENAGAIGAIICNDAADNDPDRGGTINMAAGADGLSVSIPSVF